MPALRVGRLCVLKLSISDRIAQLIGILILISILLACLYQTAYGAKALPAKPVNINAAAAAELCTLPGVGPATAKAIIAYREKNPFVKVADIDNVKGIGPKKLAKMLKYITVGGTSK